MRWRVTVPPVGTVLTWDQMNAHIRPASCSEQTYIMELLVGATAYAESRMECAVQSQTIEAVFDDEDDCNSFCARRRELELPRGPVLSITSVVDANGNAVAYKRKTVGNYEAILPKSSTNSDITVTYQAGFSPVPADISGMIGVHAATLYLTRESVSHLPANQVHDVEVFYDFRGRRKLAL